MKKSKKEAVKTIIYLVIMAILICILYVVYSNNNFYDFVKAVREGERTSFTRDSDITYINGEASYKIENTDFNDSMFYKKIQVTPYTAYKVTCMVKTENVENQNELLSGGAQIAINETTESSRAITGTTDWTELTFMFNSNSRTEVEIGFRLGGYEEYSKGTAWFSDFKIEEGSLDEDTNWHMACFIIENVNLTLDEKDINLKMTEKDINTIVTNMARFQESIKEISGNKMTVTYDIINITEPLTTISYDEENEYYVGPSDAYNLIDDYVTSNEYDYIYVAVRLGDLTLGTESLVHDWIGLRSNGI